MEEVTAGVYLVSINRSRYSAVYGWGPCKNGFPSRGHQRGSASAAAQAWLEKEICNFSPSKSNSVRLSKRLSVYTSCNKCLKKVDLEIFCCENAISIRDFHSKYWNALLTGLVL
jgi:hypothetical protein